MQDTKNKLLLIDDDIALTVLLSKYLTDHGFTVTAVNEPRSAIETIKQSRPDLVVLDVMLPDSDGFTLLRTLRSQSEIPVIMLTARGEAVDRILGLELGADDYIAKPFEPRELVARIKAILKRHVRNPDEKIRSGDFVIDPISRSVEVRESLIEFTTMEYDLLYLLVTNPGRKFTRDQLLTEIHETETESYGRAIDNLVNRVRRKIDRVSDSSCIKTVWGTGYMYTEQRKTPQDD
jgi:DNA-binding response OmpR family regulator